MAHGNGSKSNSSLIATLSHVSQLGVLKTTRDLGACGPAPTAVVER